MVSFLQIKHFQLPNLFNASKSATFPFIPIINSVYNNDHYFLIFIIIVCMHFKTWTSSTHLLTTTLHTLFHGFFLSNHSFQESRVTCLFIYPLFPSILHRGISNLSLIPWKSNRFFRRCSYFFYWFPVVLPNNLSSHPLLTTLHTYDPGLDQPTFLPECCWWNFSQPARISYPSSYS